MYHLNNDHDLRSIAKGLGVGAKIVISMLYHWISGQCCNDFVTLKSGGELALVLWDHSLKNIVYEPRMKVHDA
jgi:hypothetical protein